ncbi:MAG: metalloregulator ArsR/SmtB family transcription factor [Cyanobacteria bacterium P01_D01_bin.105]
MSNSKPKDVCQTRCFNIELVTRVQNTLPSDDTLETAQIIFDALSDRSRLKILYALGQGQELCVCDIATLLEVKVATASHHLRKLRDLKILKYRNDGKLAYYSLRDQRVADILHYGLRQLVGESAQV